MRGVTHRSRIRAFPAVPFLGRPVTDRADLGNAPSQRWLFQVHRNHKSWDREAARAIIGQYRARPSALGRPYRAQGLPPRPHSRAAASPRGRQRSSIAMQTGKLDKFPWLPCALLAAAAQSTGGGVRRRRVLGHCAQHRRPGPLTRPCRDRFPPPSLSLVPASLVFFFNGPHPFPPCVSPVACWARAPLARLRQHAQEKRQESGVVAVGAAGVGGDGADRPGRRGCGQRADGGQDGHAHPRPVCGARACQQRDRDGDGQRAGHPPVVGTDRSGVQETVGYGKGSLYCL